LGVVIIAIAIFISSDVMFKSGVSFLVIGSIFMLKDLLYMIRFK